MNRKIPFVSSPRSSRYEIDDWEDIFLKNIPLAQWNKYRNSQTIIEIEILAKKLLSISESFESNIKITNIVKKTFNTLTKKDKKYISFDKHS